MFCLKCGKQIGEVSKFCKNCGNRIDINAKKETASNINKYTPRLKTPNGISARLAPNAIMNMVLTLIVFIAIMFLGNYHIIFVTDESANLFDIARRDSFGFSEIFIDVMEIKETPYICRRFAYPLGNRVLQRKGYIKSDEETVEEIRERFKKSMDELKGKWKD